ncbi:MAG: glycosyltransferase family 2 protein [Bacteroidaceae bacterium]|nr:glycosyltransferase family 2 protein [Bacteroidaceae bacterium]
MSDKEKIIERVLFNAVPSAEIKRIAEKATGTYTLLYIKDTEVVWGYLAEERMIQVMDNTGAAMVYADRYVVKSGQTEKSPTIDYQFGSLRDDFDFGAVVMLRTSSLKEAASRMNADYRFAGFYDLRLKLSQKYELVHINEYLYTEQERDLRLSGQKQFDYVDPRNRERQIEMEQACTEHLKEIGGYLKPLFKSVDFNQAAFTYEASVIIPVKNRVKTIADAIQSVLKQETEFPFNVIIVDNHSTDGTNELIESLATDQRVVHVVPERTDLGIGGCWNMGIHHPMCGKFAIQLDSDDLYSDEHTLSKMVNAFYEQQCAMVVGTYRMTDFDLNTLPPGIIDHREWTPENGRNNALRINGLGAPRAFFTPIIRQIGFPNTSYGEDYAVGLAISRHYQIGRVYDVVYLCRRWSGNSDAALNAFQVNANNLYKDRIRSWELQSRLTSDR